MKRLVGFVLAMLVLAVPISASAQHDLSVYATWDDGEAVLTPWYVYNGPILVDARYNFDQSTTGAAFVGKAYLVRGLSIMPYVGVLAGKYNGVSAQVNLSAESGAITAFAMNQYCYGIGNDHADFTYQWLDVLWHPDPCLALGIDAQAYTEPGIPLFVDAGPVVKVVPMPHLYLKAWGMVDPRNGWDRTLIIGIGFLPDEYRVNF